MYSKEFSKDVFMFSAHSIFSNVISKTSVVLTVNLFLHWHHCAVPIHVVIYSPVLVCTNLRLDISSMILMSSNSMPISIILIDALISNSFKLPIQRIIIKRRSIGRMHLSTLGWIYRSYRIIIMREIIWIVSSVIASLCNWH